MLLLRKDDLVNFRKSSDYNLTRDFLNIYLDELINGIKVIVENVEVITKDELINLLKTYSGYQNMSTKMREYVLKTIDVMVSNNIVKITNNELISLA